MLTPPSLERHGIVTHGFARAVVYSQSMKTKTKVDAGKRPNSVPVKWYAVRPVLLAFLVAELLAAAGLIAREPEAITYWFNRATAELRLNLAAIELGLVFLAIVTIALIGVRAIRGDRLHFRQWFRRSLPENLRERSVSAVA